MKETPNIYPLQGYSFLFWLIVPGILTWLAFNYVLGALTEKPAWADNKTQVQTVRKVTPYIPSYPDIQKEGTGLVTLWFDDAWQSQYSVAAPLLKERGFTGAIAIPTGLVGYDKYANWAQLRTLQQEGWEITNHTVVHNCEMEKWDSGKIRQELENATNDLWANTLASDGFVSPCGVNSEALLHIVREKFISFRGTEPGLNDITALDPYDLRVRNVTSETKAEQLMSWVQEAAEQDKWVILVFHQVGDKVGGTGEDYAVRTDDFITLIDYLKEQHMQVVLPTQVIRISQLTHE